MQHPFVDFTYSGNNGVAPVTVSFQCNLSDPYVMHWDFGDGTTGKGRDVTHTYVNQGYYKVYANAKSPEGVGGAVHNLNVSPYHKLSIYRINGGVAYHTPDGSTWDTEPGETNPDLYLKIVNSAGAEITGVNGYAHAPNVLSVQYPISPLISITDFDGYFTVYFLDYDFTSLDDDTLGIYKFRPADYFRDTLPFPDHFVMTDSATGAGINVNVVWTN